MGMREYETILIAKADLTDEAVAAIGAKVEKAIVAMKGVVLLQENWGKRKLAYDIGRHSKGHYLFFLYVGGGAAVAEVERLLKIDENVLRYMTVKVDEDVDPEARAKALKERQESPPPPPIDSDRGGRGDDRRSFGGDFGGSRHRGMGDDDDDM